MARLARGIVVPDSARQRMAASRDWVLRAAGGELGDADMPVYGVNTGYGSLARVRIDGADIERLSMNLVRSHAAGVGAAVPPDVTRAMMLLRANALAKGASGCAPVLVDTLVSMLAAGVVPEVPCQGSCGSSGDLAPLAHLGLVVFRAADGSTDATGRAWFGGELMSGEAAMAAAGIERVVPGPKDGLAMTNGAQLSTAYAVLAAEDARALVLAAEVAAAMSFEALRGVSRALHPAVHALRPYPGAVACAANLRRLLTGSTLVDSIPDKVQDAYALRCTPQVVGAARDGIAFAVRQVGVEVNAATDNPLILVDVDADNKAFSAGLFHGEPVGMAADHLKLAVAEIGALSERRSYRLTTGTLSARLPPLLVQRDRPGIGLMAPQTTAAALVSENRALCWPASADSIPTCEDQEDHVAMSTTAARRAADVVANVRNIVAIEVLCAATALWWRMRKEGAVPCPAVAAALGVVEGALDGRGTGCPADDIARIEPLVAGELADVVMASAGPLQEVPLG